MDIDGGALLAAAPSQHFGEVMYRQWMIRMALRTQRKGFAEERKVSMNTYNVTASAHATDSSDNKTLMADFQWLLELKLIDT